MFLMKLNILASGINTTVLSTSGTNRLTVSGSLLKSLAGIFVTEKIFFRNVTNFLFKAFFYIDLRIFRNIIKNHFVFQQDIKCMR